MTHSLGVAPVGGKNKRVYSRPSRMLKGGAWGSRLHLVVGEMASAALRWLRAVIRCVYEGCRDPRLITAQSNGEAQKRGSEEKFRYLRASDAYLHRRARVPTWVSQVHCKVV